MRAAIGCRPDAADGERDLLALATFLVVAVHDEARITNDKYRATLNVVVAGRKHSRNASKNNDVNAEAVSMACRAFFTFFRPTPPGSSSS